MKIRDYSRFWADRFNDELSEVVWNPIIANGTNCVNKLFSSFYNEKKKLTIWNANTVLCQSLSLYAVHFILNPVLFQLYVVLLLIYVAHL